MEDGELRDSVSAAISDLPLEDMFWVSRGVEGRELARAILTVLGRRMGREFLDEVSAELVERANILRGKGMDEELEVAQMLDHSDLFVELDEIEAAVTGGHSGGAPA